MKSFYIKILLSVLFVAGINQQSKACYANYTHSNACAGDTVWFYALDLSAVHSWDFGDTTSGNPNMAFDDTVFHIYTTPGTYYVTHFDNIGAEWAFETQVITISANCFGAAFNAQCGGSMSFSFISQSIGNNLSYQWTFGEPSSGSADTSNLLNPYHYYSSTGNFTVTLIISDGTQSDTTSQIINVSTNCMSASISYMANPCAGDTTHFYYNFSGVTNVLWNFGDPSSGIANTSTDMVPWHIFSTPGLYIGSVIYTDGTNTDTLAVITNVVDCSVWPGDANRSGNVDGDDILAIALYYGDTGTVRTGATTNFTSQDCDDWGTHASTFTGNMYLNDMVNLKNADCNGDGVINDLDVQAVTQNFGMVSHPHNVESQMQLVPASAPHLGISFSSSMYDGWNDTGVATVNLGTNSTPANNIYGISLTIQYDPSLIEGSSIMIDFSGSWLDTTGNPNLISFYHNDEVNGFLTIALARTNHITKNGFGEIAKITFGFAGNDGVIDMNILQSVKVMTNNMFGTSGYIQNFIDVNTNSGSSSVIWGGINEISSSNNLTVYPSPANDVLTISSKENVRNAQLKIYDAAGRILFTGKFSGTSSTVDVKNFADGVYLVEVNDGVNIFRSRFIVSK